MPKDFTGFKISSISTGKKTSENRYIYPVNRYTVYVKVIAEAFQTAFFFASWSKVQTHIPDANHML